MAVLILSERATAGIPISSTVVARATHHDNAPVMVHRNRSKRIWHELIVRQDDPSKNYCYVCTKETRAYVHIRTQKGGCGIRGVERDALAKQRPEKNKNIIRYVTGRKKNVSLGETYTRVDGMYTTPWRGVGKRRRYVRGVSGWMMIYF